MNNELFDEKKKKKKTSNRYKLGEFCVGVKVPKSKTKDGKRAALEGALRQFKRLVKEAGVIDEFKARQEYVKPSVKKRHTKMQAVRRNKRDVENNRWEP